MQIKVETSFKAATSRYALKCMRLKDLATSESEMRALKNEKDILQMLDHPFVVKYVKFFLDESSGRLPRTVLRTAA